MKKNLILVGFMGTGKSAVGRRLATHLSMRFVDMDKEIEDDQGMPISDIFEKHGEAWFREREAEKVKELASQQGLIISTGGGIVLNPDNITEFEKSGKVICLKASVDAILRRLVNDSRRPLLQGENKRDRVKQLMLDRKKYYEAIALQVDTTYMSHEEVAAAVYNAYSQ